MKSEEIKKFYKGFADKILERRFYSPYTLRRYFHQQRYSSILKYLKTDDKVLEVGCGEGILSVFAAQKGVQITALDISRPNLEAAKKFAEEQGVERNIKFIESDAENLPFPDNSFDMVIADNILEHLPNFEKGLSEIRRVTRKNAIIALPTCLNPCGWCLLGGDIYWKITRRTPYAIFWGFLRVLLGVLLGRKGVNEWYGGVKGIPHLWRYPWVMKKELKEAGFKIVSFEPISIYLPYLVFLLPLIKFLDKYKTKPILKNFGHGSIAYLEKV